MLRQILNDLPNFPENVIEQWLEPFAQDEGWPPLSERWRYLLKIPDLDYWRSIEWKMEEFNPEALKLSRSARESLSSLIRAYVADEDNIYSRSLGQRGKDRFQLHLHQLIDNGVFPGPPVLVDHGKGFEIMDGNHRLAAYFVWVKWKNNEFFLSKLGKTPTVLSERQPIWFGVFNA